MYESIEIGHVLKSLRKSMDLSQQQLAEGICTQAQISKIENSNEIPSSLIFSSSKSLTSRQSVMSPMKQMDFALGAHSLNTHPAARPS